MISHKIWAMQIEINRNQPKLYPFSLKYAFIPTQPSPNFQTHLHKSIVLIGYY